MSPIGAASAEWGLRYWGMQTPALTTDFQALHARLKRSDPLWVECAMGDFSSVARGKLVRAADFAAAGGCQLSSVLWAMGVTGGTPTQVLGDILPADYADLQLVPDLATWADRPGRHRECTVIGEPVGRWWAPRYGREMDAAEVSPRAALRRVLAACAAQGLQARVAPELELFLLVRDPAWGQEGVGSARAHPDAPQRERACEQGSLERLAHFEPFFDALYQGAETLGIPLAGRQHEAALSQFEVNFTPGDPLPMADAVFRFKRLAREVAARHGFLASFAAKPFLDQPGTGMHWHVSLQRTGAEWPHVFANPDGSSTEDLLHFVGGLQAHSRAAMAVLAPFDMSFDRIRLSDASPTHAAWGADDRHAAFRIPTAGPAGRRVENRLAGGDANPYLTVATTLALGLAGMGQSLLPTSDRTEQTALPRSLPEALDAFETSAELRRWLGDPLVDLFTAIKRHEHGERMACADPRREWDLRHLIELA